MAAVNISEREVRLATLAGCLALLYVFIQFFLLPEWDSIGKLKDQARVRRTEFKVAEIKMRTLHEIEKRSGLIQLKSELPREEKALEILRVLSQASEKSGLNLIIIKPMLEEKGEGIKFNLTCSGSYKNLYDFLTILYQMRVLILIDSLSAASGGGTKPEINVNIALTAYY